MSTELTAQQSQWLAKNGLDQPTWSALQNSLFPGAKAESIILYVNYCKARNLDIMTKPAHIVGMSVKNTKTNQNEWRDVIMPGISLHRITASRTGLYAGQDAPVLGPVVELNIGGEKVQAPESCTVTVYRMFDGQKLAFSHTEFFEEACSTKKDGKLNAMWKKRKRGQLAKCAEAGALRKAFPEELGGEITAEEVVSDYIDGSVIEAGTDHISTENKETIKKLAHQAGQSISELLENEKLSSLDEMTEDRGKALIKAMAYKVSQSTNGASQNQPQAESEPVDY